ncbi:DUF4185 domain-containing protein [Rhodococcus sp. Z13]|uniref:DUF4185 domain-containing protein n=1 Tax=Rhodococcus sacchari TaxID=2962047 RepID=A0ACD4DGX5_9NOCA|nr:DUF4185 domain-containing protein [Rhodococcus sp. Z13]UYP19307.1 DUF4185 domain-containing protein [Rhodococcus sp. Z13]
MTLRRGLAGSCAVLLGLAVLVATAPTAGAEPCGSPGVIGSGPLGSLGSGSGGSGSSGGLPAQGPQGPLPTLDSGPTRTVAWVTGPRSINDTYERFTISGTDLGIMWDNGGEGEDRQLLMAFGDTFGNCSVPGQQWRHNVLMRSTDTGLEDGIDVPDPVPGDLRAGSPVLLEDPDFSRELVGSLGLEGVEVTVIPTAGIAVDGVQYLNLMSVRAWGEHGEWWTNASMIATSGNNGETWTIQPSTVRLNLPVDVPGLRQVSQGNENFQQHAYVRHEEYVYDFGTPQGRFGAAHLSRVPADALLDLAAYEYWNGQEWVPDDPSAAVPVLPAAVGEMSVAHLGGKFVVLYGNEMLGRIEMRTAERPEGPWSEPRVLVTAQQIGGLYAPYIHPWSSGNDLYFTASSWGDYNVMLLRTTLS